MPHTAGKWRYWKAPSRAVGFAKKDRGTLHLVSFRDDEKRCEGDIVITMGKDALANARLIAAAPDLLRELKWALEAFEMNGWDGYPVDCTGIRSTIAAAEGEETKS